MDDLIKRLRAGDQYAAHKKLRTEAADALAEAQAEIARLRSLLGRYAEHVGSQEGVDFLENLLPAGFDPPPNLGQRSAYRSLLTEADAAEIRRCSAALEPRTPDTGK